MGLKVCKFGGTSMADGSTISRGASIIKADQERRFVVVSAPGKRFSGDIKVTDLLYKCADALEAGAENVFHETFDKIRVRFLNIEKEIGKDVATYTDFEEFITLVATKRYTNAYLRRALWHRYFGITSADLGATPAYTQVLAANATGRAALRRASRLSSITLLTKPADSRALPEEAARQAAISQRADLLYPLAMPTPLAGDTMMKAAPYCEK